MLTSVETSLQWKLHSLTRMLLRASIICYSPTHRFRLDLQEVSLHVWIHGIRSPYVRPVLLPDGFLLLGKSDVSLSLEYRPLCYESWNYLTIALS